MISPADPTGLATTKRHRQDMVPAGLTDPATACPTALAKGMVKGQDQMNQVGALTGRAATGPDPADQMDPAMASVMVQATVTAMVNTTGRTDLAMTIPPDQVVRMDRATASVMVQASAGVMVQATAMATVHSMASQMDLMGLTDRAMMRRRA